MNRAQVGLGATGTTPKRPLVGEIEHGIPVPEATRGGAKRAALTAALKKLKVGDSFVTTVVPKTAYVTAKEAKVSITIRTLPDKSLRVWRVK